MSHELRESLVEYMDALVDEAERRVPLYLHDERGSEHSGAGRRRRIVLGTAAALVVLLGAVGVLALRGDGGDAPVDVIDSSPDVSDGQDDSGGDWNILPAGPLVPPKHGAAVWLGDELVVVGDSDTSADKPTPAAAFRPATQQWREIAPAPVPIHEVEAATATDDGLVVVGTRVTGFMEHGPELELMLLRYVADADEWTMVPVPGGGQSYYERLAIAWTGTEIVLWGYDWLQEQPPLATAYDPANDSWRSIDPGPLTYRSPIGFAWTGSELVVLGGDPDWIGEPDPLGAAYDPTLDSWRTIPASPVHTDLHVLWPEVVWTGSEIILWDGSMPADKAGARYNPATDEWASMAPDPFPSRVLTPTVVWAGDRLLVVDGRSESTRTSAVYDPEGDEWTTIEHPPGGSACASVGVWADGVTYLWGGNVDCTGASRPRANLLAYRPPDSDRADGSADGSSQQNLDERWDDWSIERIAVPGASPLDQGRQLYLDVDGGSMMLSLMPGVEIRSPQIDNRIDGYPVTVIEVPGSTAVQWSVAIGDGTIRLWSVDVGEQRTREVLEAAVRSLGEQMDGDLVLPDEATLVGERDSDSERPSGEAWRAVAPSGAEHQIGRVRIASPVHEHELALVVRLVGGREIASDPISIWFTPQMDDPSIGTISWVEGGFRWSIGGLTDDVQEAHDFMAAAPHLVSRG